MERSVGISRKAISSSWVVAARKTCPSSAVTLSKPPLPWLVLLAGGKPGENQSPKLEYKPISGGVRGLRTLVRARGKRRRRECTRIETSGGGRARDSEGSRAFEHRESNLHTLHKRDTNHWMGRKRGGVSETRTSRVVLLENTVIGCVARERREMNSVIRDGFLWNRAFPSCRCWAMFYGKFAVSATCLIR